MKDNVSINDGESLKVTQKTDASPVNLNEDIKTSNNPFIMANNDAFLDAIVYKMCKLLSSLRGRGMSVSKSKFNSINIPLEKANYIDDIVRDRLSILNKVETLVFGSPQTTLKNLMDVSPSEIDSMSRNTIRFIEDKASGNINILLVGV